MADILRHEVYCGQCFEEFYGQEYCQNLRKDLEKLKDELYDCDSQRFWREWVVPTVNLLRRLVHMGFPVRSKDFIVVHLYNPVDSMAMGEMHFQVGRKAPGTLTLKFTKQNASGAYVIQPKTLSNSEEQRLTMDSIMFLEIVRHEFRQSSNYADFSNTMQILVLMTDTCKLQRYCATTFLSKNKNDRFSGSNGREPTSMFYHSTPINPSISTNPWVTAMPSVTSFHPEASIRPPDGNYHLPMNFCVKNYVNYGARTPSDVSLHGGQPYGTGFVQLNNQNFRKPSLAARQVSSASTCHSEPEENDETMDPAVTQAAIRVAELQRRMSDVTLWDAPMKQPPAPQSASSFRTTQSQTTRVAEEYSGNSQPVPESLPRSLSNDITRLTATVTAESLRRHSEPKITRVEEYFSSNSPKNSESDFRSSRTSVNEKTSLTEEYAQDQVERVPLPRVELNNSFRTDFVDSYICDSGSTESSSDSRSRTSSFDAYVGEKSSSKSVQSSSLQTNLTVPNVVRHKSNSCDCLKPVTVPFAISSSKESSHILHRVPAEEWTYRQPNGEMSSLSQSTFPSWGSHRNYPVNDSTNPMIPLVVEKINRGDYQSWDHLISTSSSVSS